MATFFIEKRKCKNGISYRVLYKDSASFKNKYRKSYRRYKAARKEADRLRTLLDTAKRTEVKAKQSRCMTFQEMAEQVEKSWRNLLQKIWGHVMGIQQKIFGISAKRIMKEKKS